MSDPFDDFVATLHKSIDTSTNWATDVTLVPTPTATSTFDASRTLPSVTVGDHQTENDFRIVGKLGEGGMGIVELAEQTALGRLVAMKSAHVDKGTSKRRLLEEAQVLGHLEHPNVVPVYVLGERKEDGSPVIVMRRIEGVEWSLKLRSDSVDLEYHLRVLLQVCNALRFSHDRGIIHRDLKPENVMIGDYGEVYLLDWGIALSMDGEHGLPSPETTEGIAGTPAYMSPEMAQPLNDQLDRRTDVYLLGAVLHELLDGSPPHKGNNFLSVCFAAFRSDPKEYGEDVNPELGEIARRAMQKNREDRYQSVTEFATAIEHALEHEASFVLSDAAKERFTEFEEGDDTDLARLLTEAEFGYRQALKIWDGNVTAKEGVQRCVYARVERALDAGDIATARGAYSELEEDAQLLQKIDARAKEVAEQAAHVGYLESVEADQDLRHGSRSRQRFALILMIAFAGLTTFSAYQVRVYDLQPTAVDNWNSYPRLAAVFFIGLLVFRKRLFGNVANRRIAMIGSATFVLMAAMRYIHMQADSSMLVGLVSEQVLIAMSAAAMGVVSRSMLITLTGLSYVVIGMVGFLIGSDWIFLQLLSLAHILYFGSMAWVWRPAKTRM